MADQPDLQPGGTRRRARQAGAESRPDAVPSTSRTHTQPQDLSKASEKSSSQKVKGKAPKRKSPSEPEGPSKKVGRKSSAKSSAGKDDKRKKKGKASKEEEAPSVSTTDQGESVNTEPEVVNQEEHSQSRSTRGRQKTQKNKKKQSGTRKSSQKSSVSSASGSSSSSSRKRKSSGSVSAAKATTSSAGVSSHIEAELNRESPEPSGNPKKRLRSHTQDPEASTSREGSGVGREEDVPSSAPQTISTKRKSRGKKTGSSASSSGRHTAQSRSQVGGSQSSGSRGSGRERGGAPGKSQSAGLMSSQEGNNGEGGARPREEGASASTAGGPPSGSGGPSSGAPDNDAEDNDMGRLQALLEARGLPSHLFGALGPRMHQLLHRTMSGGTSHQIEREFLELFDSEDQLFNMLKPMPDHPTFSVSKVQSLQTSLQSGNEDSQLSAAIEMNQMLVMGNEDSLAGFPVKQVVPSLIQLLHPDKNLEIQLNACRALAYMMEALPRSSSVVVDAVPQLLQKLLQIGCMDVAETALTALKTLSSRHGKSILQAGGIKACLGYLDFFGLTAQRNALSVTANCVQNMSAEDFHHIRESLQLLSDRVLSEDKKCVESICLCFSRLVDNFQTDQRLLKEIAVHGLLTNIQQLLIMTPPVISTATFVTVVRMLAVMCASCPDLAVVLLKQKIAETLCYLLIGSSERNVQSNIELVPRTPQELYEIVCLIGELLPKLPADGIFAIDNSLRKGSGSVCSDSVVWQWQDDRGAWHAYTPIDSKIIESAYITGEEEVSLSTLGRSYTIELNSMQQINEDTGTSRHVQRRVNAVAVNAQQSSTSVGQAGDPSLERCDSRAEILKEDSGLASSFTQTLFAVLYEVYSSSAGPTIRHKCLQTLLRMIYYASPTLLNEVLRSQPVSSHIAAMLASPDLKVVVGAIQMAETLMQKLPDIFSVYFRREGVMHQVRNLAEWDLATPSASKSNLACSSLSLSSASSASSSSSSPGLSSTDVIKPGEGEPSASCQGASAQPEEQSASSGQSPGISDVLKRKKPPPKRGPNRKGNKTEEAPLDSASRTGSGRNSRGKSSAAKDAKTGPASRMSSFLPSLNPRSWGRSSSATDRAPLPKVDPILQKGIVTANPANKEKIKAWIKEQAIKFMEKYFSEEGPGHSSSHPAMSVLNNLCQATENLTVDNDKGAQCLMAIATIMTASDVSSFEIIHSGLVHKLLVYLTSIDGATTRDLRLRMFLHVFLQCPAPEVTFMKDMPHNGMEPPALAALTSKILGCLHQLEQFQVKVHDLPGGGTSSGRGTNAFRFFSTHQLKCQLQRHPACTNLREWKGGTVKIDPLALVQAIERYLVMRGFGRIKEGEDEGSDDENSDEDVDETMTSVIMNQGATMHKLEFLMGDHTLPYNMTVYQAIQQYRTAPEHEDPEVDESSPLGSSGIWTQTHTIWYRPASDADDHHATSPKKTRAETKSSKVSKKKSEDSCKEGPVMVPQLLTFLSDKLPSFVTVQDPSLEVITLLRVLHALNRCWATFYEVSFFPNPVLASFEFLSNKLTAKANRQLQDPLIIMTGNLPNWLSEIGSVAPFLFPFDTRQMLFFATSFDRDRAMSRLQQEMPGDSSANDTERVGPRLDRLRKQISRVDILKQAEKVMDELKNVKAMLEVHYLDEEGSGLGPTLEFYALVSQELQRSDLELWRGEVTKLPSPGDPGVTVEYAYSPCGLFPAPLARNAKPAQVNRVKAKFKFLGKFMAKALMDSRMVDIPLSLVFYKWMLNQENSLTSSDLMHIDSGLAKSFRQLEDMAFQKKHILADKTLTDDARQEALNNVTMDGSSVEDMGLYFVLPGYPNVELKRGGKEIAVTLENLEEYLQLSVQWSLVDGVSRQFEAFREGFESIFPLSSLHYFYPEELEQLFCGSSGDAWDMKTLMDYCRPDHGYNHDSRAIKSLFEILTSYNVSEQRDFLRFVTGSPRLPVGGFKSLNPMMTIVRKSFDTSDNPDDYLPSVMTCVNYLKLPDYSTIEVMRQKLHVAIKEGQLAFHLS